MTSATSRGLLFGTAAESYERFRLGYPDEVVDRTLGYAGRPVTRAVEVGAGTGKATRAFASRGLRVTALEPDEQMHAVLCRETVGMSVRPVHTAFEAYDGPPTELVYAAASWHWTDPATRYRAAADLLVDGGVLAVFGSPLRLADADVQRSVAAVSPDALADVAFRPPETDAADGLGWLDAELRGSDLFTDVRLHHVTREVQLPQREYVGYLSTLSVYLALPTEERQDVLHRISEVVPAQVRVDLGVGLHLARKA